MLKLDNALGQKDRRSWCPDVHGAPISPNVGLRTKRNNDWLFHSMMAPFKSLNWLGRQTISTVQFISLHNYSPKHSPSHYHDYTRVFLGKHLRCLNAGPVSQTVSQH